MNNQELWRRFEERRKRVEKKSKERAFDLRKLDMEGGEFVNQEQRGIFSLLK